MCLPFKHYVLQKIVEFCFFNLSKLFYKSELFFHYLKFQQEKFFGGYPTVDILKRKRNVLLGMAAASDDDGKEIEDGARNPPWMQCCLKSYYLVKSDRWGTRNYRIFGTMLVV